MKETLENNLIFEHENAPDREFRMFDTAELLARRETFLGRLKDEVLNGMAPDDLAYFFTLRIFRAMRAAERYALLEERKLSLLEARWAGRSF